MQFEWNYGSGDRWGDEVSIEKSPEILTIRSHGKSYAKKISVIGSQTRKRKNHAIFFNLNNWQFSSLMTRKLVPKKIFLDERKIDHRLALIPHTLCADPCLFFIHLLYIWCYLCQTCLFGHKTHHNHKMISFSVDSR